MMPFTITLKQRQDFHTIDRQVYGRLVLRLGLDPQQSKKVVAFWNWLETREYENFVENMQPVPDALLYGLALEAITCINCLNNKSFTPRFVDNDKYVPLMRSLVSQDFSLGFVFENREDVICKLDKFVKEVCDRVFCDIVPRNLASGVQSMVPYNGSLVHNGVQYLVPHSESLVLNGRNLANGVHSMVPHSGFQSMVPHSGFQSMVPNGGFQSSLVPHSGFQSLVPHSGRSLANGVQSLVPHSGRRRLANGVQSLVPKSESLVNNGQILVPRRQILVPHSKSQSQFSHGLQDNECHSHSQMGTSQAAANVTQDLLSTAPQNDPTLFITFSKGHPITKQELKDVITRTYGDCVEAISMNMHPEPLFALVVVRSPSVLEEILGDKKVVKFSINGKDARVRRFIQKAWNNNLFTSNSSRLAI